MRTPLGARDLALSAIVVVAVSRFVDAPFAWAVGALLLAAVALGTLQLLADVDPAGHAAGVAVEALIVPSLTAFAAVAAIRLIPVGLGLVAALLAVAWFLRQTVTTEARLARASGPPSTSDRTTVLLEALIVGVAAFAGVAALLPGGLAEPSTIPAVRPTASQLAGLAGADALVAFLLGYRVAALRSANLLDVAWSAGTAAVLIAIASAALRSIDIPRLLGPTLLVLVFFLWEAIHGGAPTRRRDPRRIWEAALLAVLGAVVVGWSIGLRA